MSTPRKTDLEAALNHKYRLADGRSVVNVTTISKLMDLGKSIAFAYAAVKIAQDGGNFREAWDEKGDRGTRIHGHLESFLRGEDIEQADDEQGYVDALEKFLVEKQPTPIRSEAIVLSEHGFGGRFDLLCEIEGQTWLIDAKTGREYPIEHTLQLAAYAHADGFAVYDDDGAVVGIDPLPPIDVTAGLYVHEDGTYDLIRLPADDDAFKAFLALLDALEWSKTQAMKAEVKGAEIRREARLAANPAVEEEL